MTHIVAEGGGQRDRPLTGWLSFELVAIVDIADPGLYVAGVPHERFALLRREEPLSWHEEEDGAGFWALVRHADVAEAGKDWRRFSSAWGSTLEELDEEQLAVRRSMLDMDPPAHTRLRRLIGPSFTPKVVGSFETAIRLMTRETIAKAVELGSFDFVELISKPLPVLWLCQHLGLPAEDAGLLIELTDRMLGQDDPDYIEEGADPEVTRLAPFGTMAGLESYRYAAQLAAERRANPGDDVITEILFAEPGGEPLTDAEFQNFFSVLMIAGQEASRHSISHGILLLKQHPEAVAALQEEPGLIDDAVEEIIRWASPIYHFRRTATADVSMHGRTIRAGDKVTLWYVSANFDEEVIPDPYRFDIRRHPNDHLSFGRGPHFCLGAALARLQVKITFEELLDYLPRLELTGPPERLRSNFIHGIKRIPVRVS